MKIDYKLSVAFCAVDETSSLENAFRKIESYHAASEYIFILSKTCTEGCLKTVQRLCAREDCRWMFQSGSGLGNAIQDVIENANGTHLLIWPADNGMDTTEFPTMAALSRKNPKSIVTISRWLRKESFQNYGKMRKIVNYLSQKAFSFLYHSDLTDYTVPMQIAPLNLYRSIRWEETGFSFVPEMTFKPLRLGAHFIEIPCKDFGRQGRKSHSNLWELLKYYYVVWRIRWMNLDDIRKEDADK